MANMCWNRVSLRGEREWLRALHEELSTSLKDEAADGWTHVLVARLAVAGVVIELDRHSFEADMDFTEEDDNTARIDLAYETKWAPNTSLIAAAATSLPFTHVTLDAEESGSEVYEYSEWVEGKLTSRTEAAWVAEHEDGRVYLMKTEEWPAEGGRKKTTKWWRDAEHDEVGFDKIVADILSAEWYEYDDYEEDEARDAALRAAIGHATSKDLRSLIPALPAFATHESEAVRLFAAKRSDIPVESLVLLYADPSEEVRSVALQNKPDKVKAWLEERGMDAEAVDAVPAEWMAEIFSK